MSKGKNPFAERLKKVDGGKASDIASAWDELVKKQELKRERTPTNSAVETQEMIKVSLWVPKKIKNDIDALVELLKQNTMSRPFAKSSVIIREALELGYPQIKEKLRKFFE
ncbi:MAG: hypothetical protein ACTSQY_09165 [Candidatus Odinarchaeia archaeon]